MGKCWICTHPKRKEIDRALVSGTVPIRAIASQWQVGREALRRHVNSGHIAAKITKSAAAKEAVETDDLLQEVREIEALAKGIITDSLNRKKKIKDDKGEIIEVPAPDNTTALKAIDSRAKQIELKGRVMKLLSESPGGKEGLFTTIPAEELARMILKGKK